MGITIGPSASPTVGSSEYYLASASTTPTYQTTDAVVQALLDFAALTAGDEFRVRVYEKIDGTNLRAIYEATVIGVQSEPFVTPAFILGVAWEVSVKKIAGNDRAVGVCLNKVTG